MFTKESNMYTNIAVYRYTIHINNRTSIDLYGKCLPFVEHKYMYIYASIEENI